MHHRVVHFEPLAKGSLCKAGIVPHLPEHLTHPPIGRLVLRSCCHYSSKLECWPLVAILATTQAAAVLWDDLEEAHVPIFEARPSHPSITRPSHHLGA
jgi:hypothetical protein